MLVARCPQGFHWVCLLLQPRGRARRLVHSRHGVEPVVPGKQRGNERALLRADSWRGETAFQVKESAGRCARPRRGVASAGLFPQWVGKRAGREGLRACSAGVSMAAGRLTPGVGAHL